MTGRRIRWRDDRGQAVSTELLLLLIVALIGVAREWAFSRNRSRAAAPSRYPA